MFFPKKRKAQLAIVVTALVAFFPGSYMAHGVTTTNLTFVVNPFTGALLINVPISGSFGTLDSPDTVTVVTAQLESVTVTDNRRTDFARGWIASAISTDLLAGTDSITASSIGYAAGLPTIVSGFAGVTEHTQTSLNTSIKVQTGATLTGNHVVSWRPTLSIAVPKFAASGAYIGTLTHSVV